LISKKRTKCFYVHAAGSDRLRVSIDLKTIDVSKFLPVSRGFHWIDETPYNR